MPYDSADPLTPRSFPTRRSSDLEQPGVDVSVGTSGTGGGFKRFCNDEIDIADASRPIKDEEKAACTDRKSTRLNSSHGYISYAVFCLKQTKRRAGIARRPKTSSS